jgi:hypothetical protein
VSLVNSTLDLPEGFLRLFRTRSATRQILRRTRWTKAERNVTFLDGSWGSAISISTGRPEMCSFH